MPSRLTWLNFRLCFDDNPYDSNEQAYQWKKVTDHDLQQIAAEIMRCTESFEVLYAGNGITTTPEWKAYAPRLLAILIILKYDQHPELLERLISTYPLPLIEAITSQCWGGGAPISSPIYVSDDPLSGKNVFGNIVTNYRDRKIKEREAKQPA